MLNKSKKIIIISVCILSVILLILGFLPKFVFLSPITYSNNSDLDVDSNKEIKVLILDSVKDLFLLGYSANQNELYATSDPTKIIQCDKDSNISKSLFFIIDKDFMKDLTLNENGEYEVIVKSYFPTSYFCHITITQTDTGYKITNFQLDV